jgi:hypothetical protein
MKKLNGANSLQFLNLKPQDLFVFPYLMDLLARIGGPRGNLITQIIVGKPFENVDTQYIWTAWRMNISLLAASL